MRVLFKLQNIIKKMREKGKTDSEIQDAIKSADKREEKTETEELITTLEQTGVTVEEVIMTIPFIIELQRKAEQEMRNNWRKMHGLPMRRKRKGKRKHERGKRTDSH